MNASVIFWEICMGGGLLLHFGACIVYGSRIQRYLEFLGESSTFLGFNGAFYRDYLRARRIAKKWGHKPDFLRRFERMETIALTLFLCGLIIFFLLDV
jgi:hypothetical protein